MKKVKIMLTAITVLAVVGGALAFKAKSYSAACVYSLNGTGTECPLIGLRDFNNNADEITGTFIDPIQGSCAQAPATTTVADCDTPLKPVIE